MKNNFPKVSIIITVFNGMPFLKDAVEKLLDQTYLNTEIVIVNDGSTDYTSKYLSTIKNKNRIKIFETKRIGRSKALNLGLKKCSGEYIAINDSDDFSKKTRIEKQVNFLIKNEEYVLVGSKINLYDLNQLKPLKYDDGFRPISDIQIRKYFLKGQPFEHSSVMYRKKAALKISGYNEKINFLIDRDFFLRISKIGKMHNINECLIFKGNGDSQHFKNTYIGNTRIIRDFKYRFKASLIYNTVLIEKLNILFLFFWSLLPLTLRKIIKKIKT